MKRFTTLDQLLKHRLQGGIFAVIKRALLTEQEIAHPETYDPENGSVWLLQSTDDDHVMVSIFGNALTDILLL